MIDPVTAAGASGTGVTLTQGAVQFLSYVRGVRNTDVISAMFDAIGNRVHGSEKIKVIHLAENRADLWW